jgi:hypothetical protein
LLPEEPFEDRLDVVDTAQHALDARATPAEAKHGEMARVRLAGSLAIDDDRDARLEVRLADEELAAAGKLGDEELSGRRQAAAICSRSAA